VGGALSLLVVLYVSLSDWPKLIFGVIVFVGGLLFGLRITRTLRKPDFDNLRLMSSGLGPLSGPISKLLDVLERIVSPEPTLVVV